MCGRYTITVEPQELAVRFGAHLPAEMIVPRYNAAPTQELPVLTNREPDQIQLFRWGLVPFWADDPSIGNRMINARGETVDEKPSFRTAFQRRRCLVPTDGFYEWQKTPAGKQPIRIILKSEELFAFAGLWETWTPNGDDDAITPLHTFTILTTEPNELVASIHTRMPVVLLPEDERVWLDDDAGPDTWKRVIKPYPAERMTAYRVSTRVNSPTNEDPSVIVPAE